MTELKPPTPGRCVFGHHVYSAEDAAVAICEFTGRQVGRIETGRYVRSLAFKRHAPVFSPISKYAMAICDAEVQVWDVTSPANFTRSGTIPATAGWRWLGHGSMDHDRGMLYVVEHKQDTTRRRRLVGVDLTYPSRPMRWGEAELGYSDSRGGVVEVFSYRAKRLAAVTWSPHHTAIVDITRPPYFDVLSVSVLPCFQAMAVKGDNLYGHDGLEQRSWWSSWTDLDTPTPRFLSKRYLDSGGYFYDQDPNLRAFKRGEGTDEHHTLVSGVLYGLAGEYVQILQASPASGIMQPKALIELKAPAPHGVPFEPVLIDHDPTPGPLRVRVWGYSAYTPDGGEPPPPEVRRVGRKVLASASGGEAQMGWRYWLGEIEAEPTPRLLSVVELHGA